MMIDTCGPKQLIEPESVTRGPAYSFYQDNKMKDVIDKIIKVVSEGKMTSFVSKKWIQLGVEGGAMIICPCCKRIVPEGVWT